jgi:hypothetical protein
MISSFFRLFAPLSGAALQRHQVGGEFGSLRLGLGSRFVQEILQLVGIGDEVVLVAAG